MMSPRQRPRPISTLMNLAGRTALVTGGAGHLGRAFAEVLGELGASVAVADLDRDAVDRVASQLRRKFDVPAIGLKLDLARERQVRQVPELVARRLGPLDILINNAALGGTSKLPGWAVPLADQQSDTWRKALEVNLTAVFTLCQAAAPALTRTGRGVIVNIASIYGLVGPDPSLYPGTDLGNPAAYAASKGGLLQLTRWLATSLAPSVRVNALVPGGIRRQQPLSFQRRYVRRTPLQRMGTEEDMTGALAYLSSDLSAYVTGHTLVVDGGWTAW